MFFKSFGFNKSVREKERRQRVDAERRQRVDAERGKLKNAVNSALLCLYLEVDESIARDIQSKVDSLMDSYEAEIKILR